MWHRRSFLRPGLLAAAVLCLGPVASAEPQDTPERETPGLGELSLEQLLGTRVVSASNTSEALPQAPATVIVITADEIRERGYTELSEILDDLPGMEVVRPYGATYLKNYWRGFRNTIGDAYLIMVDGVILNHLYFNTADVMVTLPLSNVERVEIVYGPASAVYGPNAFMGVINVITVEDKPASGAYQDVRLTAGSNDTRIADVQLLYKADDLRLSLAGRFDNGDVDRQSGERYEYTRNAYFADRRLWGGFVDNPNLGGAFTSPHGHRSLDLRARLKTLELGFLYELLDSGYGVEYAGDQSQNHAVWARPDYTLFVRAGHALSPTLSSSTLVRYRRSDVSSDSYFVVSEPGTLPDGRPAQLVDFSFWQALSSSWSAFQDLDYKPTARLSFTAGLKYEQKDLQKAYDTSDGPALPAETLDASKYPYPPPPPRTPQSQNRITTEDEGAYLLGRYGVDHHQLHLGLRYDHNSRYGGATTVRAGYVGNYGSWGAKALFGQAFQEPTPRLLYGGWTGSGSDPNLDPQRSHTMEISGSYKSRRFTSLLSAYYVGNEATFINTAAGAQNLGMRKVVGFDYHVGALVHPPGLKHLRLWGYYTRLLKADEKKGTGTIRIGDLADDKILVGATAVFAGHLSATLRGRRIGSRPTVATNPAGKVPAYTTVDATVCWRGLIAKGSSLALKVTNLLDEEYAHPGVRDADAGLEPGRFDADGRWVGSKGFYSSLLPQPGRAALLSLSLDF